MKILLIKLLISLLIVLGLVLVFNFTPLSINQFTPSNIKTFVLQFGKIAPLIFIIIYTLRSVIPIIPVGFLSLIGGSLFGTWWGTIYILTGAVTGATVAFLIARYWGKSIIGRIKWVHRDDVRKINNRIAKNGFQFIFIIRLIPFFQYDVINYGAGFSKMKFQHFIIGSFIGMIPGGFIRAFVGNSLNDIFSVQTASFLVVFLLLILIPIIYRAKKKEHYLLRMKEDK